MRKCFEHIWSLYQNIICQCKASQRLPFSFDNGINFGARVSIVIRYVIIYAHKTKSTLFRIQCELSLSLNRAPHHTTHAHIEHAHFWFVSISFTVSNILMKMRSTSSRTHQSSIYTVHIVIWQMLWEMWHDCSGTF